MVEGRLKLLKKWRAITLKAATAIKKLYPQAEIYLFGGAAEGRLTVLSDIDLAVVVDVEPGSRGEMLARIWEELEREGIPQYYPLEIHVLSRDEIARLRGVKIRIC